MAGAGAAGAAPVVFPLDANLLNVRDFGAVGDGVVDDTAALQAALNQRPNGGSVVYLPDGDYLVSDRLEWPAGPNVNTGGDGTDGWEWKGVALIGESRGGAVLRLAENAAGFQDAGNRRGVLWTGPLNETRDRTYTTNQGTFTGRFGAQRFENYVQNLTVDTGTTNPGAAGVQLAASNLGGIRDVRITGRGAVGLDMAFVENIGPLIVKDVEVDGFDVGIRTSSGINSQTLEDVTLRNQGRFGIEDSGQSLFIKGLTSLNAVPVLDQRGSGHIVLTDASLVGTGSAGSVAAVQSNAKLFARNITTTGYARALDRLGAGGTTAPAGPVIGEYVSAPLVRGFDTATTRSLNLAVPETPDPGLDPDLGNWVNPLSLGLGGVATPFNGTLESEADITTALQAAFDTAGASTVYLPSDAEKAYPALRGTYVAQFDRSTGEDAEVFIRGDVERFTGARRAGLVGDTPVTSRGVDVIVQDGSSEIVVIEGLRIPRLIINTDRTVVIKGSAIDEIVNNGRGELFLEDVITRSAFEVKEGQTVWARQFDSEPVSPDRKDANLPHILNDGGQLWILGLKTEGGGTIIETRNGGQTELLGSHIYTNLSTDNDGDAYRTAPMFINNRSIVSVSASELNFGVGIYETALREITDAGTLDLSLGSENGILKHYGSGLSIPLYTANLVPEPGLGLVLLGLTGLATLRRR